MAARPKKSLLRPFKGFGQLRERDGDANWFPVEFLFYFDEHNNVQEFPYVRREDEREIRPVHQCRKQVHSSGAMRKSYVQEYRRGQQNRECLGTEGRDE